LDPATDLLARCPRLRPENLEANQPFVTLLRAVAAEKRATPAQIALAWLLAQKPWIVPIPGTRRIDHLGENLGALAVTLTPADLRTIGTALAGIQVHGERMDAPNMRVIDETR